MNKKLFLGLGSITAIAAPIATIISCDGSNDEKVNQAKEDMKLIQSNIIWTKTTDEIQSLFNEVKLGDDITSKLTSDAGLKNIFQPIFVKGTNEGDKKSEVSYIFKSWNQTDEAKADTVVITATLKNGDNFETKEITINTLGEISKDGDKTEAIKKIKMLIEGDIFRYNNSYFIGNKPFPTIEKDGKIPSDFFTTYVANTHVTSYKANRLLEGFIPEDSAIKVVSKYEVQPLPAAGKFIDIKIPVYLETTSVNDFINKKQDAEKSTKYNFNLNIRIKTPIS